MLGEMSFTKARCYIMNIELGGGGGGGEEAGSQRIFKFSIERYEQRRVVPI